MSTSIILTGGGTAGHVMPNLALLPYLKDYFDEFHYIGSENGVEKDIIAGYPFIRYHTIPVVKLVRSLNIKNLAIPFKLSASKRQAKKLLAAIRPAVIFSKGGYVALPVVLSAKHIPVICHESDLSLGLANRLSAKHCEAVCTSFPSAAKNLKNGIHTGAPIRSEIYAGKQLDLNLTKDLPTVLIMGGSLGAKAINACVEQCLGALTTRFNVIHIVGKNNLFPVRNTGKGVYCQLDFTDRIADYYATADYVVSRGGAGSMFELAALTKPALIIPLPKGSSRGDQIQNAEYFSSIGCCHVLSQDRLDGDQLLRALDRLCSDKMIKPNLERIRNIDGTKAIAKLIIQTAQKQ